MKKNKEQFLTALLKLIDAVGDKQPIWAAILCTVAAAVEIDKDKELADICNSFLNNLREELIERSEKSEKCLNSYTYLDALEDFEGFESFDDFDDPWCPSAGAQRSSISTNDSKIIEEEYEDDLENLIEGFIFNKEGNS